MRPTQTLAWYWNMHKVGSTICRHCSAIDNKAVHLDWIGGELFEYIFRQRYLKEQEACRLFSQLVSSVHYMHQKNIVHRDLKLVSVSNAQSYDNLILKKEVLYYRKTSCWIAMETS